MMNTSTGQRSALKEINPNQVLQRTPSRSTEKLLFSNNVIDKPRKAETSKQSPSNSGNVFSEIPTPSRKAFNIFRDIPKPVNQQSSGPTQKSMQSKEKRQVVVLQRIIEEQDEVIENMSKHIIFLKWALLVRQDARKASTWEDDTESEKQRASAEHLKHHIDDISATPKKRRLQEESPSKELGGVKEHFSTPSVTPSRTPNHTHHTSSNTLSASFDKVSTVSSDEKSVMSGGNKLKTGSLADRLKGMEDALFSKRTSATIPIAAGAVAGTSTSSSHGKANATDIEENEKEAEEQGQEAGQGQGGVFEKGSLHNVLHAANTPFRYPLPSRSNKEQPKVSEEKEGGHEKADVAERLWKRSAGVKRSGEKNEASDDEESVFNHLDDFERLSMSFPPSTTAASQSQSHYQNILPVHTMHADKSKSVSSSVPLKPAMKSSSKNINSSTPTSPSSSTARSDLHHDNKSAEEEDTDSTEPLEGSVVEAKTLHQLIRQAKAHSMKTLWQEKQRHFLSKSRANVTTPSITNSSKSPVADASTSSMHPAVVTYEVAKQQQLYATQTKKHSLSGIFSAASSSSTSSLLLPVAADLQVLEESILNYHYLPSAFAPLTPLGEVSIVLGNKNATSAFITAAGGSPPAPVILSELSSVKAKLSSWKDRYSSQ